MRILRVRSGFQADHSSSSYLFYAVDQPVSAKGQQLAHRYSSRADVDEHTARYHKWGESSLSSEAFPALLSGHYDVLASESYDSWTLMIAVPKTPQMVSLLAPFCNLDDGEYTRLDVHDYGKRLAVEIFCEFTYEGPVFSRWGEDPLEELTERLAMIRKEIIEGNVSFLQAVAAFYVSSAEDEEEPEDEEAEPQAEELTHYSKAELQQECTARGIPFRKSWTKEQLRDALHVATGGAAKPGHWTKPAKLSPAAKAIVHSLDHR
jgi:hypothetical protein